MKIRTAILIITFSLSVGCTYKKGRIWLKTDPPGAEVYVGGTKVGETPTSFDYLCCFDRELRIVKDGYYQRSEILNKFWIKREDVYGHLGKTTTMMDGEMRRVWTVSIYRKLDKLRHTEYHTPAKSTFDQTESSKHITQASRGEEPKFTCSSRVREMLRNGQKVRLCIIISEAENACPLPENTNIDSWKKAIKVEMANFWEGVALEAGANEPNFTLVERAKLKHILEEHQLSEVGLFSDETRLKIGKLLGVNYIVDVALVRYCVLPLMRDVTTIKLIDVQTGRILASDRYEMIRDSQTADILKVFLNYREMSD